MAFKNTYQPPAAGYPPNIHLDTPQDEYDYNFMFEVATLKSDRVEMRPFLPSRDAQAMVEGIKAAPELLDYIPAAGFDTLNDVCVFAEDGRRSPAMLRYAIYTAPLDRLDAPSDDYVFAGTVTLMESSAENMMSEIGYLIVLAPFHRTHVMTHAVGLLLHRVLDAPADGGLGLRRCQWKAHSLNERSLASALRMGFVHEGVIRAWVVMPPGKKGIRAGRPGPLEERTQRDTWIAGITWYEWEEGVRAHVDKLMARRK